MKRIFLTLAAGLAIAACESAERGAVSGQDGQTGQSEITGQTVAEMENMTVTGALSYRQRIALPADAMVKISIWDAGLTAEQEAPFAERSFALNGRQVPIPFEIELGAGIELETDALRLEAQITNGRGNVLWENAETAMFDFQPGNADLDVIALAPTRAAVVDKSELTGREWLAARMGGEALLHTSRVTINFSEDGRLSGNASCNAYTGSYTLEEGELSIGPLALTRKACVPQLMDQEQGFISMLQNVSDVRVDRTGKLLLETTDGETITAR
ncbi:META domain-containing protein [Henriciella sp.]|uniref:META domain-containing protein n=1 Tax=Henriciella sp. TaxID=1968823 RepID=UPI0026173A8F|nr:META domain-containing protein [Henriciella sp.]